MNMRYSGSIIPLLLTLLFSSPIYVHAITITPVPGSPFTGLSNGQYSGLAYAPNGTWLASANSLSNYNVSIYTVAANGVISQISGSPFATNGFIPECVAYSPDNQFLVAGNHGSAPSTISLFAVDQTTGALTQLDPANGSPSTNTLVTAGDRLETIYYSPHGRFIAVALNDYASYTAIQMFTTNQNTGALTSVGTFPTNHYLNGTISDEIAFSPDSKYIAQANKDSSNTITIFTVDQNTGALGPNNMGVYGTDYTVAGGSGNFSSIDYAPNGNLLVVSDQNDNLFTFTLNNGVPTFAATIAPTSPVNGNTSVAFSPDSQLIALANSLDMHIYVFSVTPNGAMTQVAQLDSPGDMSDLVFSPPVNDQVSFLSVCAPQVIASYSVPVTAKPLSPSSPTDVTASRTRNLFLLQTDLIKLITWGAPSSGNPVAYNIYRDPALTQLIGSIPATSPLQFYDHNRQPNVTYSYYITAVDASGNQSSASSVSILG